jgi:hypothetical protein
VDGHELPVATCGVDCAGASELEPKSSLELPEKSSEDDEDDDAVDDELVVEEGE